MEEEKEIRRKRKKQEMEIRKNLKDLIENERVEANYCDVGIFHFKKPSKEGYKNEYLSFLAYYLNKRFDVTLYVWNPVITRIMTRNERNKIEKLNAIVGIYEKHIIPMMDNENTIFFIPYLGYADCAGNLIKMILYKLQQQQIYQENKEIEKIRKVKMSKMENLEQTRIMLFKKSLFQDLIEFVYNSRINDINIFKFLIYWTLEVSQKRGFRFNFRDYKSIKILKIPLTSFVFIRSNNEIFYLSTEYIPLFDLYYCDLNEEFNVEYFENYMEITLNMLTSFYYGGQRSYTGDITNREALNLSIIEKSKKVASSISEKNKKSISENVNFHIIKNNSKLIYCLDEILPAVRLNKYGISKLKNKNKYSQVMMFSDDKIRLEFNEKSLIQNSLKNFIIETFYQEFHIKIHEEERSLNEDFIKIIQLIYQRWCHGWIVSTVPEITHNEKYIFDSENEKSYIGSGVHGSVWITCMKKDMKKNFDLECEYVAKFVMIKSKEDKYKFDKEYKIAKEASDNNIGVKVIDYYLIRSIIKFEDLEINALGVIVMERWPITLGDYIEQFNDEYNKNREKIKEKWVDLYYRFYNDLNYKIDDMHFGNSVIRINNDNQIEIALIDFDLAFKILYPQKRSKDYFEKEYDEQERIILQLLHHLL